MKKITLAIVLILVLALSLTSCALIEKITGKKCKEHVYDGCTDVTCNNCGEERSPLTHAYDNCDDITCNNCGVERSPVSHKYDGCTDTECNVCGVTREGSAHVFDNCDDTVCNNCSQVRPVSHNVFEVARVESTCTVAGHDKYYQCKDCNKLFANILATEALDAVPTLELADHALVAHDALAPTCDTAGYKAYYTCENCDYTTFEEIKATGHNLKTVEAKDPTCTEGGWEEYRACTNEGCDYTKDFVALDPNGHTYEDKEALDPTCTEDGYTAYKECSVCHDIVGKEVRPAEGHSYSTDYTKDASYHWHLCHCGHYVEKFVHTFTDGVCECGLPESEFVYPCEHTSKTHYDRVAPTCAATGTEEYYVCDDPLCKAYLNANGNVIAEPVVIPIDPNAHDLTHVDAKAPTCTDIGWDAYDKCTRCDYSTYEKIDANGHSEADAVKENEVAATCTTEGSYDKVVYCSVCGEEVSRITVTVDALGHTEVIDAAVAPTCTDTGLTEGKHCDVCGEVTLEQEEVAATGHKYSHSCDATCDNECGYTRPEEELEHVYSNEYDSTCNNEGCDEEREAETPDHGGTTLPEHNFGS